VERKKAKRKIESEQKSVENCYIEGLFVFIRRMVGVNSGTLPPCKKKKGILSLRWGNLPFHLTKGEKET